MELMEDDTLVSKDIPLRNAMNELLREDYMKDCQRALRKCFDYLQNDQLLIESKEDETLIKGYMVNLHPKFEDLQSIERQMQAAVGITELEEELNGFKTYEEKLRTRVLNMRC